jgi:hypothetical protein
MIKVTNRFDGANPQQADRVEQLSDTSFRIRPYSEDGDGNYKFNLLVGVRNTADKAVDVEFLIDWEDPVYMSCRDYVLLGRTDRWRYFPAALEGTVARASVVVPPGSHQLALLPTYGLARLNAWQRRAQAGGALRMRPLGQTPGGRTILAFELGDTAAAPADRIAILGGCHPYETAGSFAAEGALRAVLGARGDSAMRGWHVSAVLVGNPDGVAQGLCKRTGVGGANLEQEGGVAEDSTAAILRRWLDSVRPSVLLDLHGWMHRYQDGFTYTHEDLTAQIKERLLGNADIDRGWRGRIVGDRAPGSLWTWCMKRHGTRSLVMSFGWYGRTVPHVRRMGAAVVSALARCHDSLTI